MIDEIAVQPLLPSLEDDSTLGAELLEEHGEQVARYSGKIVERNGARVQGILAARAAGYPIRQICAAYQVSSHTIAEIERRHSAKLATLKERLARKFGVFTELGIDRAITEIGRMDIDKLMVSLGIATDKMQVLSGEASIIVGSTVPESGRFTLDRLRERLRPVIDVTPPTGLGGGEKGETRAGSDLAAGDAGAGAAAEGDS
jgi:hypothetical protein